jgi:hypothetical protein
MDIDPKQIYKCRKCDSDNITADILMTNSISEPSLRDNEYGKVSISVQVCWCSDCGEPHSSLILDVVKL